MSAVSMPRRVSEVAVAALVRPAGFSSGEVVPCPG